MFSQVGGVVKGGAGGASKVRFQVNFCDTTVVKRAIMSVQVKKGYQA